MSSTRSLVDTDDILGSLFAIEAAVDWADGCAIGAFISFNIDCSVSCCSWL